MLNLAILFTTLSCFWLVLSGVFTAFYVVAGMVCSLLVVGFYRLIYKDKTCGVIFTVLKTMRYLMWLVKEILASSLDISLKMWQLEPQILPQIITIKTNLKKNIAFTIFANSITLTPGSVTIDTDGREVKVHCLTKEYADELQSGKMLEKIMKI